MKSDRGMKQGNGRMEVGMRKGIRAFFDIDDITIAFRGSAWTGREVVTIDDRIVSKKLSLRFTTEHHFEHDGIHYKLVFRVLSMLVGHMRIELYREGELVDSDEFRQTRHGSFDPKTGKVRIWRTILKILPYFVLGMLAGSAAAWLVEYLTGG
ncbi:MAG: hypothetical protein ACNS61_13160 [Candidatus Wenzhouxiangella sp. M2_3B_020]